MPTTNVTFCLAAQVLRSALPCPAVCPQTLTCINDPNRFPCCLDQGRWAIDEEEREYDETTQFLASPSQGQPELNIPGCQTFWKAAFSAYFPGSVSRLLFHELWWLFSEVFSHFYLWTNKSSWAFTLFVFSPTQHCPITLREKKRQSGCRWKNWIIICYELCVPVSSNFMCWNPNPIWGDTRRWSLWRGYLGFLMKS